MAVLDFCEILRMASFRNSFNLYVSHFHRIRNTEFLLLEYETLHFLVEFLDSLNVDYKVNDDSGVCSYDLQAFFITH